MFKLAKTAATTISNLIGLFEKFWNSLSSGAKRTAGVITGFVALLAMGPIGLFIAGLLTILALLDDFYTWQNGGKSAYGDTWEKLSNMFSDTDTSGLDDLLDKGGKLLETLGDVGTALFDLGGDLIDFLDDLGFFGAAWQIVTGILEGAVDLLQTIADLILVITGNFDKLSDDSIFRKVIKFDENGDVKIGKTAANIGMQILDSGSDLWNTIFGFKPGDTFYAPALSDSVGYDYGTDTAARSGGFGGTFDRVATDAGDKVFNQNNNINITTNSTESADTIAQKTSRAIIRQRDQCDPFK